MKPVNKSKSSNNALKNVSLIFTFALLIVWAILPIFNYQGFKSVSFTDFTNKKQSLIWLSGIILFCLIVIFKLIATFSKNKSQFLVIFSGLLNLCLIVVGGLLIHFSNSKSVIPSFWSPDFNLGDNNVKTKTIFIALAIAIASNIISFIFFLLLTDKSPRKAKNIKKSKSKKQYTQPQQEEISPNLNGDRSNYIDEPIFATVEQDPINEMMQENKQSLFETSDGSDNVQGRVDQLRNMLLNSNWKKMGFSNRKEVEEELEKAETIAKATQNYVDTLGETFVDDYEPNMETPRMNGGVYDDSIALNSINDSVLDRDFNDTRYVNNSAINKRDERINREVADLFNDITQVNNEQNLTQPVFKQSIKHENDKTLEVKNPYVETIIPRRLRGKNVGFEAPIGNMPYSQSQKRVRPTINPSSINDNINNFIVGENDRIWNELKKQDREILNRTANFSDGQNATRFSTKQYDNEGTSFTLSSKKDAEPTFNIEDTAYYEHIETPTKNLTQEKVYDPLIEKKDQTESSEPTVDWNNS